VDLKGVRPAHWCFSSSRRSSAFSARREASESLITVQSRSRNNYRLAPQLRASWLPQIDVRHWLASQAELSSANATASAS